MAAGRVRRANAGNRLQSLLNDQIPLDDEDSKMFAEYDDDADFDIEVEEERIRRERRTRSDDEEAEESNQEITLEGTGSINAPDYAPQDGGAEVESSDDDSDHSVGDSNFSDTSDDSELENDNEPIDAGEKELQNEQRRATRENRAANQKKLFTIKQRPPSDSIKPTKTKKKRIFTSQDLINGPTRRGERRSARRNKEHLIQQMQEAEERRAQYVAPARVKAPRLTQEERLEEAKRTEFKNLSTLNKFVELEEERRIQQRLALISKRPKLTHFVRFHSTQYTSVPKLLEVVDEKDEDSDSGNLHADRAASEHLSTPPESPSQLYTLLKAETNDGTQVEKQIVKDEIPLGNEAAGLLVEPSTDLNTVPDVVVEGPTHLRSYDFLTLHEFHDVHLNRFSLRNYILGSIASNHEHPPLKRMCPFSGREAKYVNPETSVAYSDLETNRLIGYAYENKLGWSKELGGVFTQSLTPQRPAVGVPEEFLS